MGPLAFMLVLTVIGIIYTGTMPTGTGENVNLTGSGVNGTSVDIPKAGGITVDLTSSTTVLALLVGAIAVAVATSVNILGSGMSGTSQSILFNSIIFLGLWAVMTVFAINVVFTNEYMTLLWIILTILFVIGLAMHISGGTGAGDE